MSKASQDAREAAKYYSGKFLRDTFLNAAMEPRGIVYTEHVAVWALNNVRCLRFETADQEIYHCNT